MTWRFIFESSQLGLRKVLKEHEEFALRYFWDEGAADVVSRDVWTYVSGKLGEGRTISRATIIQFMKVMDELGILESREASGKGGRFPKYTAKMDEKEFQRYIARTIINSLMRDFPQITTEVLMKIIRI